MRVITFSLGFGPKLLKVQRGDTEYCISAIPLGGYVKMAGENPDDPHTGADDEFMAKSKWQRFQILIAGPVMNLAPRRGPARVRAAAGRRRAGLSRPARRWSAPCKPGSPAEKAGLVRGDLITKFGTADVRTWEHLEMAVASRPERDVEVVGAAQRRRTALQDPPGSHRADARATARGSKSAPLACCRTRTRSSRRSRPASPLKRLESRSTT